MCTQKYFQLLVKECLKQSVARLLKASFRLAAQDEGMRAAFLGMPYLDLSVKRGFWVIVQYQLDARFQIVRVAGGGRPKDFPAEVVKGVVVGDVKLRLEGKGKTGADCWHVFYGVAIPVPLIAL